ncbi:MAG: TIGR04222 domain-containing membrane protein, partial [Candidatus Magnetominusculus sp. LBB02]|nr:TIGR04222 domain-containing membrane protein [Candidatus Magnetominusculus sp. LBB02]
TTLRITYSTDSALSSGFKFVGTGNISNINITAEDGSPVSLAYERLKENKLSFGFPAVMSGNKTIVITFVMEDAIKDRLLYSLFDAQWVGKWQIPVNNAVYTFVFPQGFTYTEVDTNFASFNKLTVDGRQAIQAVQPLLAETAFSVKVKPSFGGHSFTFFVVAAISSVLLILFIAANIKSLPDSARHDTRELTPAEAAYLKKGLKHSVCVCIFDLMQLGRMVKTPPQQLQSLNPDNTYYAYEILLMGFFKTPRTLKDLFKNRAIIKDYEGDIVKSLAGKGCLKDTKAERAAAGRILFASVAAAAAAAAAWKYADTDTVYLLLSLIVPLVGVAASVVLYNLRSKTGRAQYALEKWEKQMETQPSFVRAGNPVISYGVAILGFSILAGTVFDEFLGYVSYARQLRDGSSEGCSGCSAGDSSGSSDSGSGGDGGGSGGCGGCGGGGD